MKNGEDFQILKRPILATIAVQFNQNGTFQDLGVFSILQNLVALEVWVQTKCGGHGGC